MMTSTKDQPLKDWLNLNTLDSIDRFMMYGSDNFNFDFVGVMPHKFSMTSMFESGGFDVETNEDVTRPGGKTPRDINLIMQKLSNSMMTSLGLSDSDKLTVPSHPEQEVREAEECRDGKSVESLFRSNRVNFDSLCGNNSNKNPDSGGLQRNFCHFWGWGGDDPEDEKKSDSEEKTEKDKVKENDNNKKEEDEKTKDPKQGVGRGSGHTSGPRKKTRKYRSSKQNKVMDSEDDDDMVSIDNSAESAEEEVDERKNSQGSSSTNRRRDEPKTISGVVKGSGAIKFGNDLSEDDLTTIGSSSFSLPRSSSQGQMGEEKKKRGRPSRKDKKKKADTRPNSKKRSNNSQASKSTKKTKRAP